MITWEGMSCQGKQYYGRSRGSTIHGTEGTVLIDRDGYQVFSLDDKLIQEFSTQKSSTTQDLQSIDDMTTQHFQNLLNGIRTGEKLRAPIEEANVSVTMLHLSNIAWKLDRTLHLDKQNGHVLGDKEAMTMWRLGAEGLNDDGPKRGGELHTPGRSAPHSAVSDLRDAAHKTIRVLKRDITRIEHWGILLAVILLAAYLCFRYFKARRGHLHA
jgi:hypothetical protein